MKVSGWAEVALAIPLGFAAWAVWRLLPKAVAFANPRASDRSIQSMRVTGTVFLAFAGAVALSGGLVSAV